MTSDNRQLMHRARRWVEHNECPLPLDLAFEFTAAGLDVQAIEDGLLFPNDDDAQEVA